MIGDTSVGGSEHGSISNDHLALVDFRQMGGSEVDRPYPVVGFTGTQIEKADANTRAGFGDYISVYDIQRAVVDGATVPIYYESWLAKLELKDSERPTIDPEFEEATDGKEVQRKEKLKSRWAQLEAVVGSEKRTRLIARDLVQHFENRLASMDGKAMVVVMSRRIAVDLYREIVALRPAWHGDDDEHGALKVVMTGSASDPLDWQPHIRNKRRREDMALRFRREASPRGAQLGLTEDEVAFYDALEANDSAVKVLGDENRRLIARELLKTIRANVTIDWTVRENVRAQLRVFVKRILRKYGYPPDKQTRATELVLEQAEALAAEWAA